MNTNRLSSITILGLVFAAGLSWSHGIFASDRYLVHARVFHLGELVAQPVLEVEANETSGGTFTSKAGRQFTFVVLLRPMAEQRAYVSMQFSSGTIDIQPNLLVDIGKERSATFKKVRMSLQVVGVPDPEPSGQLALRHE
jgi:hypothetical protein